MLPSNEISWGGTFASPTAAGSPFPASTQVVLTPLVMNLDDDNGDGRVDERDFPEIIFATFCNSDFQTNGILRAIRDQRQRESVLVAFAPVQGSRVGELQARFDIVLGFTPEG